MTDLGFWSTARRECRRMASRKMYLFMMVVVPVAIFLFFTGLLSPGLPLRVPTAIVDLDHTPMSRKVTRSLNAGELVNISEHLESYTDAMASVRRGDIFGFFVIPPKFEKDVLSGKKPTLEYYTNLTYFVPGTLSFKGFKTVSVTTAAGVVSAQMSAMGLTPDMVSAMIQPVDVQEHPIGNPWLNYSIYLSPSFCFGALALMIMLSTCFCISMEIKNDTSRQWLAGAHGHITVALAGKLLPHFVVWSVMGQFMLSLLFCWQHFPCGNLPALCLAMELFIIGCMAMGVLFCSIVPNPRLSMTLSALIGILTFSFVGFSFPVQNMYGPIAIFSYLVPCRYMFLIYIFTGLNAFPVYYSRLDFLALLLFPLICSLLIRRLRNACLNPVYVP